MWKLESSSFSNSAGRRSGVTLRDFTFSDISAVSFRARASSSMQASPLVSLSSTLIFISRGLKSGTFTAAAIFATAVRSRFSGTPRLAAYRLAAARRKSTCRASFASNLIGAGGRFGPLQNFVPSDVTWSSGKVWSNCTMESWNFSWNSITAYSAHASKAIVRLSSMCWRERKRCTCDVPDPVVGSFRRYDSGSSRKLLPSRGVSTNSCSNASRAHSMVCSMAFGKCLTVHSGIDSSGGS
mmetsp:Transcript_8836/g.20918  ORF Transcript_8836/g.20918 Transcript_8836/m.20918 type:complete len:240 (+) Transcript_8836:696-1415(+)